MPIWQPEEKWKGLEVFIIGGGPSLKEFDWDLLKPEMTIGCNTAFTLGEDVCKICVFGDTNWFDRFEKRLLNFKGVVFTNLPNFLHTKKPWIWTMKRKKIGLGVNELGWNANTGALAINLALILGAKIVNLLGFDMGLSDKQEPNWHTESIEKPDKDVYSKFIAAFENVERDRKKLFPNSRIVNVTNGSRLNVFPKVNFDVFWKGRK